MNKKLLFKGRRILITAGSTWAAIDDVRVITNIFGGALGVCIAEEALKYGANVTLLLGPGRVQPPENSKHFKVITFKYYDELLSLVTTHVSSGKYDIMIHSAAVTDYIPLRKVQGKIKSTLGEMTIHLKKTIKIVDLVKKLNPTIFLVKFKLEAGLSERELLAIAHRSMQSSMADLIVANDFNKMAKEHRAYIIDGKKHVTRCDTKRHIAKALLVTIAKKLHG